MWRPTIVAIPRRGSLVPAPAEILGPAFMSAPTPLMLIDRTSVIVAVNDLAGDWLDARPGHQITKGLAAIDVGSNADALELVFSGALPQPIVVGHPAEADGRPRRAVANLVAPGSDLAVVALGYTAPGAREYDELTGLLSRRSILDALERRLAEAARHGAALTVALVDLDFFKAVNDRLGHAAGDAALRAVSGAICSRIRETDDAGRIGGDELLLLLPSADRAAARPLLEELLARIGELTVTGWGRRHRLSASVGACVVPPGAGGTAQEVLGRADDALRQAKDAGRSRVTVTTAPVPATQRVVTPRAGAVPQPSS